MPLDERPSGSDDQSSDTESSGRSDSMSDECFRQSFTSDSSSKPDSPARSPPTLITFDKMMASTSSLFNLTLAHEIVATDNFHLENFDLPQNSLEKRVKEVVHQAFWNHLESDLSEDPPEYEHAIKLLEEIRETLLSFLMPENGPNVNRLRKQICEVLDIDLIKQEAEHGAVDIYGLAMYIVNTMLKLCAPVRDEDVKKLKMTTDIVQLLRDIFHVLDLMQMDMINFAIGNLRPYLQCHSVEYERATFKDILSKTPNALRLTTEWIKESYEELSASLASTDLSSSCATENSSSVSAVTPMSVLKHSFLKLMQWDYQKKVMPETLMTDELRYRELKEKLDPLKLTAAVLLITYNLVGQAIADLPDLNERFKRVTAVLLEGMHLGTFDVDMALESISMQIFSLVNNSLKERGFPVLCAEVQTSLRGQICSITKENNTVRLLIENRIQQYLTNALNAPAARKIPPAVQGGLTPIQAELESIAAQFFALVNYNRQVYGPFYADILRKVLFSETSKETTDNEVAQLTEGTQ